jgi:hypothetical protein
MMTQLAIAIVSNMVASPITMLMTLVRNHKLCNQGNTQTSKDASAHESDAS